MTALVYLRNDGPDPCTVELGRRQLLIRPGDELRLNVANRKLAVAPVPPEPTEYLGVRLEPARVGED